MANKSDRSPHALAVGGVTRKASNKSEKDEEKTTTFPLPSILNDRVFYLGIGVVIGFILLASLISLASFYEDTHFPTSYNGTCAKLPSKNEIDTFCKAEGYKYGWISTTTCDGIQCYKDERGGASRYTCFDIKEMD
jgi:hypothetical protein